MSALNVHMVSNANVRTNEHTHTHAILQHSELIELVWIYSIKPTKIYLYFTLLYHPLFTSSDQKRIIKEIPFFFFFIVFSFFAPSSSANGFGDWH